MERFGRLRIALKWIHGPEAAGGSVQVPRAVVVEVQVGIQLLAREEVIVWRRAVAVRQDSEGVVVVGVCDRARGIRQRTD